MTYFHPMRHRVLRALVALGLAAALGACVAYPDYPGYGYGYGPYYGGYPSSYVSVGGGWGWNGGDRHDGDWHGGDWHGGDWHGGDWHGHDGH